MKTSAKIIRISFQKQDPITENIPGNTGGGVQIVGRSGESAGADVMTILPRSCRAHNKSEYYFFLFKFKKQQQQPQQQGSSSSSSSSSSSRGNGSGSSSRGRAGLTQWGARGTHKGRPCIMPYTDLLPGPTTHTLLHPRHRTSRTNSCTSMY